ncbi:mannose-6-phosphate isomerase-like protein (cupin superfamily) [Enterobacter sp. BIGb0383]|nr:mannose-6-phosphate isomerase-like protein (cupin superfamily) [Enterobacter sp. BIGb0383]ROS12518.1 mannose-6-phosphate isomerase-like protein (cupin superfamily) [Enterobacter sp. BIGb0359]
MTVISRETAEHYTWGDVCDGWHLLKRQDMSIIHERMPADSKEVRHYHTTSRQFFFVLSGVLTMELEGKIHSLPAHHGLEIPPGEKHQAQNRSASDVEFMVISHPTTRGDRMDCEEPSSRLP